MHIHKATPSLRSLDALATCTEDIFYCDMLVLATHPHILMTPSLISPSVDMGYYHSEGGAQDRWSLPVLGSSTHLRQEEGKWAGYYSAHLM